MLARVLGYYVRLWAVAGAMARSPRVPSLKPRAVSLRNKHPQVHGLRPSVRGSRRSALMTIRSLDMAGVMIERPCPITRCRPSRQRCSLRHGGRGTSDPMPIRFSHGLAAPPAPVPPSNAQPQGSEQPLPYKGHPWPVCQTDLSGAFEKLIPLRRLAQCPCRLPRSPVSLAATPL